VKKLDNAAEKKKVEEQKRRANEERRKELNDIKTVVSSVSGRRLLWRVMEKCNTFSSIWEPSAKIHYNSGQQDIGHFILAEITNADENLLFKMMKESKEGENNV